MKKILRTLAYLSTGYILNCAPINSNAQTIPAYSQKSIQQIVGEKELKCDEKYTIKATHTRSLSSPTKQSLEDKLEVKFTDGKTSLVLYDYHYNGLSQGDFLVLKHDFNNQYNLKLKITYLGENNLLVESELTNNNQVCRKSKIDTSKMNKIKRFLISNKMKSFIKWGGDTYASLLNSLNKDQKINLPYKTLKSSLDEIEKFLPELKEVNGKGDEKLKRICKEKFELITKR